MEVDVNDNGLREALAGPLLPLRNGAVEVPDTPGLGYEPDLDALVDLRTEYFDRRIAT
jgi:L-alanine-DL-glutamate epimerase-like enolase superfamily enzyme